MQRTHETEVATKSGLGVCRGVKRPEAEAEDRRSKDRGPPSTRHRESRETSGGGRDRDEDQRDRPEALAQEAAGGARRELRDAHRGEEKTESGERCVERCAHRRPGDAEYARRQAKEDE